MMTLKKFQCGSKVLDLSQANIMGILNVTPDSFSDGGQYPGLEAALHAVEVMIAQGADIIDVGGESTRPGAQPVSLAQELERVVPVVEAINQRFDTVISVDTSTPGVMMEVAKAGAHMLNDVRALRREGALQAAAATQLPVCLMHMQGQPSTMQQAPGYNDVLADIYDFLAERKQACEAVGIGSDRLLLDPGFGFGKSVSHNYQLLNQLEHFQSLELPLLIGVSRKTMIGQVLNDRAPKQRVRGSVAAAVIAAMKGAAILRVHDVAETWDALQVVKATLNAGECTLNAQS